MKKKLLAVLLCGVMAMSVLAGCGSSNASSSSASASASEASVSASAEASAEASTAATDTQATDADANAACSDESFAAIQDAYASLVQAKDAVTEYYVNNDAVAQDDNVETVLNKAQEYIDYVGEIEQTSLTENDALELVNSMLEVAQALSTTAEAIAQ